MVVALATPAGRVCTWRDRAGSIGAVAGRSATASVSYHGVVNEQFRKYWPVYLLVVLGAVLVLLASVYIGTSAVLWIGAIVGVAVGMAVAAVTRKHEQ